MTRRLRSWYERVILRKSWWRVSVVDQDGFVVEEACFYGTKEDLMPFRRCNEFGDSIPIYVSRETAAALRRIGGNMARYDTILKAVEEERAMEAAP